MPTILDRFKVQNFRSIEESDWIEVSSNSCLVGTNEAGKTNLLLALWKLNPVNNEPIIPLNDFPRHLYSNYSADNHSQDVFISADFILDPSFQEHVAGTLGCDIEQIQRVLVQRKYDGTYLVTFPYSKIDSVEVTRIKELMVKFEADLYIEDFFIKESGTLQMTVKEHFQELYDTMPQDLFSKKHALQIIESLQELMSGNFGKKKNLPQYFNDNLISHIQNC